MNLSNPLLKYTLEMADHSMILGQRLSEWCGHGPVLEQDIALTNMALDLIGEARYLYQYASELTDAAYDEDHFPFKRVERQYFNLLLVERPNGHWGDTLMRQVMYDCYHYFYLQALRKSSNVRFAEIAEKTLKEATYHLRYSSEWVIRLGDGTEESHQKMQKSLEDLYPYFEEAFIPSQAHLVLVEEGVAPHPKEYADAAREKFQSIITDAGLVLPQLDVFQKGGKEGVHSEHLGHMLAVMQYYPRTYADAKW